MYLRWAGGKTRLANEIISEFPQEFDRYFEPFCGSAAMYLAYADKISQLQETEFDEEEDKAHYPSEVYLSDINSALIHCHRTVRDNLYELKTELISFEKKHKLDPEGTYSLERSLVTDCGETIKCAARFIYINKTCFNGLWRVNKSGEFNDPWSQKREVNLRSKKLNTASRLFQGINLIEQNYDEFVRNRCRNGDFVYLDPPYYPLSETSNFTTYTKGGFDPDKGIKALKYLCNWMSDQGIRWLMSNSSAKQVYKTFRGFHIQEITAHRFVKALGENETREQVEETLIRNY